MRSLIGLFLSPICADRIPLADLASFPQPQTAVIVSHFSVNANDAAELSIVGRHSDLSDADAVLGHGDEYSGKIGLTGYDTSPLSKAGRKQLIREAHYTQMRSVGYYDEDHMQDFNEELEDSDKHDKHGHDNHDHLSYDDYKDHEDEMYREAIPSGLEMHIVHESLLHVVDDDICCNYDDVENHTCKGFQKMVFDRSGKFEPPVPKKRLSMTVSTLSLIDKELQKTKWRLTQPGRYFVLLSNCGYQNLYWDGENTYSSDEEYDEHGNFMLQWRDTGVKFTGGELVLKNIAEGTWYLTGKESRSYTWHKGFLAVYVVLFVFWMYLLFWGYLVAERKYLDISKSLSAPALNIDGTAPAKELRREVRGFCSGELFSCNGIWDFFVPNPTGESPKNVFHMLGNLVVYHRLVMYALAAGILQHVSMSLYFFEYGRSGINPAHPELGALLIHLFSTVAAALRDTTFVTVGLLIGLGLGLTRSHINKREKAYLFLSVSSYLILELMADFEFFRSTVRIVRPELKDQHMPFRQGGHHLGNGQSTFHSEENHDEDHSTFMGILATIPIAGLYQSCKRQMIILYHGGFVSLILVLRCILLAGLSSWFFISLQSKVSVVSECTEGNDVEESENVLGGTTTNAQNTAKYVRYNRYEEKIVVKGKHTYNYDPDSATDAIRSIVCDDLKVGIAYNYSLEAVEFMCNNVFVPTRRMANPKVHYTYFMRGLRQQDVAGIYVCMYYGFITMILTFALTTLGEIVNGGPIIEDLEVCIGALQLFYVLLVMFLIGPHRLIGRSMVIEESESVEMTKKPRRKQVQQVSGAV